MNKFIRNYGYLFYTFVIVLMLLMSLRYDFFILNKQFKYVLLIRYYSIAIIGLYSFLKTDKPKGRYAITCMICGLILSSELIILIPIALLAFIFFSTKYKFWVRVALPCILVLFILRFSFGLIINDFVYSFIEVKEHHRESNTNGTLDYVIISHDQGALGLDFTLHFEKNILNLFVVQKKLMIIDGNETIYWINNKSLSVDDKIIK